MLDTITVDRAHWRMMCREVQRVARAKARKAAAAQRKVYWAQAYWAQALRFETFKVGGLRFIKLGSLSISVCVTQPRGEQANA